MRSLSCSPILLPQSYSNILILLISPKYIYNSGYKTLYNGNLFYVNVLRPGQTETGTHLDQLLEQLPIRCDL